MNYLIEQIYQYMMWQAEKLNNVEKEMKALKEQIATLCDEQQKEKIGKIEYNFDQLKVETLEGTLHIGVSPQDGQMIEEFAVNQANMKNGQPFNQQGLAPIQFNQATQMDQGNANQGNPGGNVGNMQANQTPQASSEWYPSIQKTIHAYLDEEVYEQMIQLENQHAAVLIQSERTWIIEDIRKQIDTRIKGYMNKPWSKEQIIAQVKQDITMAMDTYLSKRPKQDGEPPTPPPSSPTS